MTECSEEPGGAGEPRPQRGIEPGLEVRQELVAHAVAQVSRVGVGGVLAPVQAALAQVGEDLGPGDPQERAQEAADLESLARPEWPALEDPDENLSSHFGMGITAATDNLHDLAPGLELELDGTRWTVLDTSGHSPGGRTIYCAELSIAFVGDAVFAGSIGRTDFHHSDHHRFLENLHANIMTLPDDTRLYTGHGPPTTVATERATNPFLRQLHERSILRTRFPEM